jgi:hypothetical protein
MFEGRSFSFVRSLHRFLPNRIFPLILTLVFLIPVSTPAAEPEIPIASWEHWILETLQARESPRPDGNARMAALPTWVDCHLSWRVDRPHKGVSGSKIPSEIILRSTPKICDGQLEQWAR